MRNKTPQITPATIAPILGPLLPLEPDEPLFVEPGVAVSVTTAPLEFVTVYVIALPVAIGPAVAVATGLVTVAPPVGPPPITEMIA